MITLILHCSDEKRIVLAFRGSCTFEDYKVDIDLTMGETSNPIKDEPEQRDTVLVHDGFQRKSNNLRYGGTKTNVAHIYNAFLLMFYGKDYLLGGRKADESKLDNIVGHLNALFQEYPDHHFYIAGHSLGGSLATLAAFLLVSHQQIPKPFTVITFGELAVGDLQFRRAFQAMERKKYIRSLRIVADGDLMPLLYGHGGIPLARLPRLQSNVYRQVGNQLKIYQNRKCTISYPPEVTSGLDAWWRDIPNRIGRYCLLADILCCRKGKIAEPHFLNNYLANLSQSASDLQNMSFDGIYARRYGSSES